MPCEAPVTTATFCCEGTSFPLSGVIKVANARRASENEPKTKIVKPPAEGFASHAAVLSFVADDEGCRREGGNIGPRVFETQPNQPEPP